MTLKPVPIFGRSKVTSFVVITMNFVFNYVPKEETFLIPLKYIVVTGVLILIRMSYKIRRLTIAGMSSQTYISEILGQA